MLFLEEFGFYIYYKLIDKKDSFSEYTPEQEISDKQIRNTVVKLFFKEIGSNNLKVENRTVDAKELISNPYLSLLNMLIEGPTDDTLEKTMPDGTIINSVKLIGDVLVIDLSESFISNHIGGAENESSTIYSIVNTLTELTEVNSIKFLIDGKEGCSFNDNCISFENNFVRK